MNTKAKVGIGVMVLAVAGIGAYIYARSKQVPDVTITKMDWDNFSATFSVDGKTPVVLMSTSPALKIRNGYDVAFLPDGSALVLEKDNKIAKVLAS